MDAVLSYKAIRSSPISGAAGRKYRCSVGRDRNKKQAYYQMIERIGDDNPTTRHLLISMSFHPKGLLMKKFIATCILASAFGAHSLATAADAVKAQYKADVTAADADYKAAKAKCKPLKGNEQEVCEQEAKAAHETATADAKAKRKSTDAKKDAAKTSNDAKYKVAKEKCDALSGADKDKCEAAAQSQYGK
jgi:hypothetical protein